MSPFAAILEAVKRLLLPRPGPYVPPITKDELQPHARVYDGRGNVIELPRKEPPPCRDGRS